MFVVWIFIRKDRNSLLKKVSERRSIQEISPYSVVIAEMLYRKYENGIRTVVSEWMERKKILLNFIIVDWEIDAAWQL